MKTALFHFFGFGVAYPILFTLSASASALFVDLNSTNPLAPYADWSTAATNIQDAIDVSSDGDLVLVSNGVYQTGGRVVYGSLTNRVAITKAITVQSVNGPSVTVIQGNSILGSNAVRCVYMTNNSVLSGFTVTNGGTLSSGDFLLEQSGGGIWTTNGSSAVVSNCVLIGNVAADLGGGACNGIICSSSIIQNHAYYGGGIGSMGSPSFATNCLIWSNSAAFFGGGARGLTLKNCKVLQNMASLAGGTYSGSLYGCLVASNSTSGFGIINDAHNVINCTIVNNQAVYGPAGIDGPNTVTINSIIYNNSNVSTGSPSNYLGPTIFDHCCTTPLPLTGANNITNDPGFADFANGNFQLQSNSPCINSGDYYAFVFFIPSGYIATDLDGNPRIVDGLVDMGAYEYQKPGFILPYYWAQQYGLPEDGTIDSDGDGINNWQEAVAGTDPTDATSVLKMLSVSNSPNGNIVRWQSEANKLYCLQRSTNLLANPAFVSIYTNFLIPFPAILVFTDKTATNGGSYFYRVGVK